VAVIVFTELVETIFKELEERCRGGKPADKDDFLSSTSAWCIKWFGHGCNVVMDNTSTLAPLASAWLICSSMRDAIPSRHLRKMALILSLHIHKSYVTDIGVLGQVHLRRDVHAAPFKQLLGVITKTRYSEHLMSFGLVAVEASLESVLEVGDHYRFDVSVYGVVSFLEIELVGKELAEQLAESFVKVT
jgi:hypothetical protein